MPRHAKRDAEATKAAKFLDRRSFVTLPSIYDGKAHLRLAGEDISAARGRACERATTTDGSFLDFMRCQECGIGVSDDYPDTHPRKAQMHHIERRRGMRCDCDHNLVIICKSCHDYKHGLRGSSGKLSHESSLVANRNGREGSH